MKILTLALLGVVLCLSGCPGRQQPGKTSPTNANASGNSQKRSKLIIQKEKNGSETGVYMQKLELRESMKVRGKPIDGNHRFEIGTTANYPGNKPVCLEKQNALIILHEKPVSTGWQYPASIKIVWVVDGQETRPKRVTNAPIEKEDGEWWESVITQPDCETYRHLASATNVELRINDGIIKLQNDEILALKEFVAALGF